MDGHVELAWRLLAFEASLGPSSEAPADYAAQVCERLRAPLSRLAGPASYDSLLSRARALAKAEVAPVAAEDGYVERSGDAEHPPEEGHAHQGHAALVGHLLGLLATFIGEPLALLLVRDAWPDVAMAGIDLGIKAKHERDQQG